MLNEQILQVPDSLLIIETATAKQYQVELDHANRSQTGGRSSTAGGKIAPGTTSGNSGGGQISPGMKVSGPATKSFFGAAVLNATAAKMQMISIADEVIAHLARDPQARVSIRVEINAEFPEGVKEDVRRVVSVNTESLRFVQTEWE